MEKPVFGIAPKPLDEKWVLINRFKHRLTLPRSTKLPTSSSQPFSNASSCSPDGVQVKTDSPRRLNGKGCSTFRTLRMIVNHSNRACPQVRSPEVASPKNYVKLCRASAPKGLSLQAPWSH